jgi:hypothetical protein
MQGLDQTGDTLAVAAHPLSAGKMVATKTAPVLYRINLPSALSTSPAYVPAL